MYRGINARIHRSAVTILIYLGNLWYMLAVIPVHSHSTDGTSLICFESQTTHTTQITVMCIINYNRDFHCHNSMYNTYYQYLQWFFVPQVRRLLWSLEVLGGGTVAGSNVKLGGRGTRREGCRKDWTGVGCAVDCAESLAPGECGQNCDWRSHLGYCARIGRQSISYSVSFMHQFLSSLSLSLSHL